MVESTELCSCSEMHRLSRYQGPPCRAFVTISKQTAVFSSLKVCLTLNIVCAGKDGHWLALTGCGGVMWSSLTALGILQWPTCSVFLPLWTTSLPRSPWLAFRRLSSDCLLSQSIMHLLSCCVSSWSHSSFLLSAYCNDLVWMSGSCLPIYLTEGHLDGVQVWTIRDNTVINIYLQDSL